jgi:multidrug efflux pump
VSFLKAFVNRPIMAVAINLGLLIIGLVAFNHLELKHIPASARNEFTIYTEYPGAHNLSVEQRVTKPLEDALSGLDGIDKLSSDSLDGHSAIYIKFKSHIDPNKAMSELRDRIFGTHSVLPEGVKRPYVYERSENSQPIVYIAFNDTQRSVSELSDYIRRMVEDRLRLIEGVASIDSWGGKHYQISVQLDPALLMEHKVTVSEVMNALHREKAFAAGGEIEQERGKKTVVLTAAVQVPSEYGNVIVKTTAEGNNIRIKNIATVAVTEKSTSLKMRVNGQPMVGLQVVVKPQANPLLTANRVRVFVKDLERTLPTSMEASITYDATRPFESSMLSLGHTLIEAILLVGIIVTLSLASGRAALLPVITIPLCLVGTFALMWLFGFSVNPITLLALVLAVGLVVDDAIVVVENIHHYLEEGLTPIQAASKGMKEITFAIIVMTITLAAVYVPVAFQADDSAAMFREFAWTLAGSVLISGFVALTLIPALCGRFLRKTERKGRWEALAEWYHITLQKAFNHPRWVCAMAVIIAILGIWGFARLPMELMPVEDEDYIQGYIDANNTVPEAVRTGWLIEVEKILQTIPERQVVTTHEWQQRWLEWNLSLKPRAERSRGIHEIIAELTPKLKKIVGPKVGVNIGSSGLSSDETLTVIIQYPADYTRLLDIIRTIMREARKKPEFERLKSEGTVEVPQIQVEVDRAFSEELGVNVESMEDTLYTFLSGRKATHFNFRGFDYDVVVQGAPPFRSELNSLNQFFVTNGEGQWIPLGSLVTIKESNQSNKIKHYERMRGAKISVSLKSGVSLERAMEVMTPIVKKYLPAEARYYFGGTAEKYQNAKKSIWVTYGLALVFIYLVLTALFESFMYPLVVLLTVPLSVTGAAWAVNGYGGTNNIYTSIGLITLVGLITKHGILIVDFANRLRLQNKGVLSAIQQAAVRRLRPVLMTTFAMIFGALPLLFSKGAGAVAMIHIGWVIIGGMVCGTVFSLYVVPVVYYLVSAKTKKSLFVEGGSI